MYSQTPINFFRLLDKIFETGHGRLRLYYIDCKKIGGLMTKGTYFKHYLLLNKTFDFYYSRLNHVDFKNV